MQKDIRQLAMLGLERCRSTAESLSARRNLTTSLAGPRAIESFLSSNLTVPVDQQTLRFSSSPPPPPPQPGAKSPPPPAVGFVRRLGYRLVDDQKARFKIVGPNIYWLGLDENAFPSPSYPGQTRVLEALATAALMGSTVVRSTTLGVSVGSPLSIWPTLNSTNTAALKVVGFSVFAAKRYGLRLIIPLTDQYDYYHGGYKTFLKWRNHSDSSFGSKEFFRTNSVVYEDFLRYIEVILTYVNPYNHVALKDDPTILLWETGNELEDPPREWTEGVAKFIHRLAPNQLVGSGRNGVDTQDLGIAAIDAVTNHFYPTRSDHLKADVALAAKFDKVYYVGEYDWSSTSKAWSQLGWLLLPLMLSVGVMFKKRWLTIKLNWPPNLRRPGATPGETGAGEALEAPQSQENLDSSAEIVKPAARNDVSLPTHAPDAQPNQAPPLALVTEASSIPPARLEMEGIKNHTLNLTIKNYHISAFIIIVVVPLMAGVIYLVAIKPTGISSFWDTSQSLQHNSGDLFWSLFGHDDQCCGWVEHSDGFTVHYPGRTKEERASVSKLIEHHYRFRESGTLSGSSSASNTKRSLILFPTLTQSTQSSKRPMRWRRELGQAVPRPATSLSFENRYKVDPSSLSDLVGLTCNQSLEL